MMGLIFCSVIALRVPLDDEEAYRRYEVAKGRTAKSRKKHAVTVRHLNKADFEQEMEILREIYNEAWKQNWGATALSEEEFDLIGRQFEAVADPEMILIAFMGDEPVAIFATLPDLNDCIKRKHNFWDRFDLVRIARLFRYRKKTARGRVTLLGIKEKYRRNGVADVLITDGVDRLLAKGQFDVLELSWLLETNALVIRTGEAYNAHKYKTWRIYERDLQN